MNQVGKHGLIIEFTAPDSNTKHSATYLPEVAGHEGENFLFHRCDVHLSFLQSSLVSRIIAGDNKKK